MTQSTHPGSDFGAENHPNSGSGLIRMFARNPVAANLLMLTILVAGTMAAFQIRKEFFPEFATGAIQISIVYPGAAPADVEKAVVVKVEEALADVDGIKKITAGAYEDLAMIRLEVLNGYDPDEVLTAVKSSVDGIATFPDLVKRPVITKETTRDGILWLVLSGPLDEDRIKSLAGRLKEELTASDQISHVVIEGTREREIRIELSKSALKKYGLSFDAVATAVERSTLELPGGALKTAAGDLQLRVSAVSNTAAAFRQIPLIAHAEGARVTLGQVATVVDGFEDADWFLRFQGQPAVGLQVFRVGRQRTLEVANAAKAFVKKKETELPPGVTLSVIADTSIMLRDRLQLMLKNLLFGGVLVFISLVLFLHIRVAFWVMAGLPLCLLGTIWLMMAPGIDITINMITLFGFILVLGIIVDDAIVIGENVYTTIQRCGPGTESVILGTRQVATAATFGVLTTMAAFLPMLLIPGINGKIWRGIALVVIFALLLSLIESKLILPAHLAGMKTHSRRDGPAFLRGLHGWVDSALDRFSQQVYQPILDRSLRYRAITLVLFVAIAIVTTGLVNSQRVRLVYFPEIESDTIEARMTIGAATPLAVTRAAAGRVEAAAAAVNAQIRHAFGLSGDVIRSVITLAQGPKEVWFYAELLPAEERPLGATEIIQRWRAETGDIPGVSALEFSGSTADSGSPIAFELRGKNLTHLHLAAKRLRAALGTYAAVFDITDSVISAEKELQLALTPHAAHLGVSVADLARQVRQGFWGHEVKTIQRNGEEISITLRYPRSERQGLSAIKQMHIRDANGRAHPFNLVAEGQLREGASAIERIDRHRVVYVAANVNKQVTTPQEVIKAIEAKVMPNLLSTYPDLRYHLAGEARESKETLRELKRGATLALLLIFAMLAIPLKSYLQPLIIMAAIPFGIVGAIWGHLMMGLPLSILSLCGIIALSGVVVNDSLIMIDGVNRERAAGRPIPAALKASGAARLRAILLTSLTTFIGLLPMLTERSLQAQFLIPMSVSLAFGILFATAITLILVPVLYATGNELCYDVRESVRRLFFINSRGIRRINSDYRSNINQANPTPISTKENSYADHPKRITEWQRDQNRPDNGHHHHHRRRSVDGPAK